MASYSADQIIGKNLVAKRSVALKRLPQASAATIYTVAPGNNVGTVYSYVGGREGQPLWWQFLDAKGRYYYALHDSAAFSLDVIRDQGAMSEAEQAKEQAEKKKQEQSGSMFPNFPSAGDIGKNIGKYVGYGVLIVGAAIAVNIMLSGRQRRRARRYYPSYY